MDKVHAATGQLTLLLDLICGFKPPRLWLPLPWQPDAHITLRVKPLQAVQRSHQAEGSRVKGQRSRVKGQGSRVKGQGPRAKSQGSRHGLFYFCWQTPAALHT